MSCLKNSSETCSGCSACVSICPRQAITMDSDDKGFSYPTVDMSKCIECGLCNRVCDFKQFKAGSDIPESYAVRHKTPEEVQTSRSGAFFMSLCLNVIRDGGVVCGCMMTEDLNVVHAFADNYEDCRLFKGSKYVQSDINDCFIRCADYLMNERNILLIKKR